MKAIAAHRVEADRAFAKPLFIRVDLQGRVQDRVCSDADSLPERHRSLSKTDHIEAFFQRLTSEWINRLGSFIQGAGLPRQETSQRAVPAFDRAPLNFAFIFRCLNQVDRHGAGLRQGFDIDKLRISLGFKVVTGLVRQLHEISR